MEQLAKPAGVRGNRHVFKEKARTPREIPISKAIARAQQIVIDRDRDWLSWTEIAAKHKIAETTARKSYRDYVEGVAPLLASEIPMEIGHELVRKLQGVQARIAEIAHTATHDSVRLGALNSLTRVLHEEIELRQHLGLLPKRLGDVHVISDQLWAAEQIVVVLRELEAPPEAFRRVAEILEGAAASN